MDEGSVESGDGSDEVELSVDSGDGDVIEENSGDIPEENGDIPEENDDDETTNINEGSKKKNANGSGVIPKNGHETKIDEAPKPKNGNKNNKNAEKKKKKLGQRHFLPISFVNLQMILKKKAKKIFYIQIWLSFGLMLYLLPKNNQKIQLILLRNQTERKQKI
jgi:hypothetical protein